MTVNGKQEAWTEANRLMNYDYDYDVCASRNAGYPIYTSKTGEEWISDLGSRLEVNLRNGKSVNIWIDGRSDLEKSGFKKNALGIWVAAQ